MIVRLGDLLALANEDLRDELSTELGRLNNVNDWIAIEREFRICRGLRIAKREMKGIIKKFKIKVSVEDRDLFEEAFGKIFHAERELGEYIGESLESLATMRDLPLDLENDFNRVVEEVTKFQNFLKAERQELILLETDIIEKI